ncbi:hypothetical protein JCM8208_006087 [Rhodotorula glutinis]
MGRSAKMTKRFSKADRVAKKVNAQSAPAQLSRSTSPDPAGDDDAPLAIPLFNTSVPGRVGKQQAQSSRAQQQQQPGPSAVDSDDDNDGLEPALEGDRSSSTAAVAASSSSSQKKKGGLRDKVRAAKKAVQDDEDRSNDKLSGAQKRKLAKKHNVLGKIDYVELHEARPGKKRFR